MGKKKVSIGILHQIVIWRWLKFKNVRINTQFFINKFRDFGGGPLVCERALLTRRHINFSFVYFLRLVKGKILWKLRSQKFVVKNNISVCYYTIIHTHCWRVKTPNLCTHTHPVSECLPSASRTSSCPWLPAKGRQWLLAYCLHMK